MMPKKLDVINRDDHTERFLHAAGIEDTFEIRNKINEIIDYLEDPENIIKAYKDLLDRQHEGEASKGECPHCDEKHMDGYAHNPKTCFMCRDNPPEHKCDHKTNYFMNAVNGCKVCSKKAQKALSRDGDPEHEEDFDRLAQGLRNHVIDDVRFSGLFEYVKDYILKGYVSKEKIKNLATQMGMRSSAKIVQLKTLNRLQIEDIIYDKILESLGLGD